ncbi:MAG: hypothetical protein MJY83_01445 [Bacteroidales bacterium]|nr:hypothetical protein [Bacteroidales bacterium]
MKKNIFYIALTLLSICACQKENTEKNAEGTPMTFSAVIAGNEQTKASFSDEDGSVLKFSWDAEEKISVIAFDSENKVLAVDTFTSTGEAGRTRADFTGTLTQVEGTHHLECFYPALTEHRGNQYFEQLTGHSFYSVQLNSQYSNHTSSFSYRGKTKTEHLGKYAVMSGLFKEIDGVEFVEFQHLKSVVKVVLTVPEDIVGALWSAIHIECFNGTTRQNISGSGWGYSSILKGDGPLITGGSPTNKISLYNDLDCIDSRTITEYIIAKLTKASAGNTLVISIPNYSGKTASASLTLPSDVTFQPGVMYTIHADLALE